MVTGGDNGSALNGTAQYGDYGVLSDATCGTVDGSQVCEPAADTPFPAYYGLKLAGAFLHPGDTLVSATSDGPLVHAYAAKSADGTLRVMLVNDDPATTATVSLDYAGFTPAAGAPSTSELTPPGTGISTQPRGSAAEQTLPPYTASLVTLQPGGSASATCRVAYSVNDWGSGFTGSVTLTDTGDSPVDGWTLGFDWPGDQRISTGWNAVWTQTGSHVTAGDPDWNPTLTPGTATTLGFNATYTSGNPPPTAFTLNGRPCDGG